MKPNSQHRLSRIVRHLNYLRFSLAEAALAFVPVFVHAMGQHFNLDTVLQDVMYSGAILSMVAACKYQLVLSIARRRAQTASAMLFGRALASLGFAFIVVLVLGLWYAEALSDVMRAVCALVVPLGGIAGFMIASSDYFGFSHEV